uniref:Uncharacterized protein n=1 Tax=Yamadaella caenomyce TaxID=259029 RepID=A0A1G4NZ75_9FLOR|nr:Hypothetical protein ycf36 [Yamadaella caenomyce]SCW23819.1 Hypothetical protein ycf36 [Yamadaella caenomyce]
MSSHKRKCPVPFDQQPLNEYNSLKQSILFKYSTLKSREFISRLGLFFLFLVIIFLFVSKFLENTKSISIMTMVYSILFSLLSLDMLLFRLYLGWSYVLKRLFSASIFYEESGWYDGQLWIKSVDVLTQDRLVGLYQVKPIVDKLRRLLLVVSSLIITVIVWLYLLR